MHKQWLEAARTRAPDSQTYFFCCVDCALWDAMLKDMQRPSGELVAVIGQRCLLELSVDDTLLSRMTLSPLDQFIVDVVTRYRSALRWGIDTNIAIEPPLFGSAADPTLDTFIGPDGIHIKTDAFMPPAFRILDPDELIVGVRPKGPYTISDISLEGLCYGKRVS